MAKSHEFRKCVFFRVFISLPLFRSLSSRRDLPRIGWHLVIPKLGNVCMVTLTLLCIFICFVFSFRIRRELRKILLSFACISVLPGGMMTATVQRFEWLGESVCVAKDDLLISCFIYEINSRNRLGRYFGEIGSSYKRKMKAYGGHQFAFKRLQWRYAPQSFDNHTPVYLNHIQSVDSQWLSAVCRQTSAGCRLLTKKE